jgi:hypothetical protein
MSNDTQSWKGTIRGRVDRIFVSVDESTGRSTISFQPADIGGPIVRDDDRTGANAMRDAKAIADENRGSTVHGPHFHGARPAGRKPMSRRPSNPRAR